MLFLISMRCHRPLPPELSSGMRSVGLPHRAHRHNIQLKRLWRSHAGCLPRSTGQLPRCVVTSEAPEGPAAPRAFIFGLGYVGVALAVTLRSRGWCVTKSTVRANRLPFRAVVSGPYDVEHDMELTACDASLPLAVAPGDGWPTRCR